MKRDSSFFASGIASALAWLQLLGSTVRADDFARLCENRTAIERVYFNHRLGQKPQLEQALPPAVIGKLVRDDLRKEAALKRVYGVEISSAQLDAELRRIDTTTRSPEMLAEIKAALGSDRETLARAFAKPILVERMLRERFENDTDLHVPQRRIVEGIRGRLLNEHEGDFTTRLAILKECKDAELQEMVTWTLTPRPATDAPSAPATATAPTENKASAGVYSIESTAQIAQVLSSPQDPHGEKDRKIFFEDLPVKLQELFRAQLQGPGDLSAVVETPGAFQIYLARERTPTQLTVAVLTVLKRSYEEWLGAQPDP